MDIDILLCMNGSWKQSIKVVGHRIGILPPGWYLLVYCIVCRVARTHLWYQPSWNFWRGYESLCRVFLLSPQWCIPYVDWRRFRTPFVVFHMSNLYLNQTENDFISKMSHMASEYVIQIEIHDFCFCKSFDMWCMLRFLIECGFVHSFGIYVRDRCADWQWAAQLYQRLCQQGPRCRWCWSWRICSAKCHGTVVGHL